MYHKTALFRVGIILFSLASLSGCFKASCSLTSYLTDYAEGKNYESYDEKVLEIKSAYISEDNSLSLCMAAELGYDTSENLYRLNIPVGYIKKLERMIILEQIAETLRTVKEEPGTEVCVGTRILPVNTFSEHYCFKEYQPAVEELKKATDDFRNYCRAYKVNCRGFEGTRHYKVYSAYKGVHDFRQTFPREEILKGCSDKNTQPVGWG